VVEFAGNLGYDVDTDGKFNLNEVQKARFESLKYDNPPKRLSELNRERMRLIG
jgi:hypothetical protein